MSKPLVLVDGSSYLYRAFHAMPALANSKGVATGAIYGMVNMLKRLLADYDPEHIAVVFDAKGKTFRDELYDQYKAHRPTMPSELAEQIEPIHKIIRALGLPMVMIPGVEADDVIGTISKEAETQGLDTIISTGDKDLAQLVDDHVTLVNTMTNQTLNPQTVIEKFGISPELIVDYLALIGDPVDNIPGVPKVGPKTAVKWLQEFGSLDNIVANAEHISGKVGENLRGSLSQLPLAKTLATIKRDVDLKIHFNDLQRKPPDEKMLSQLYQEFEFKNWLSEILEKVKKEHTLETKRQYEIIYSADQFKKMLKALSKLSYFALNIETNEEDYMRAEIIGIAFALEKDKGFYIPLKHIDQNAPEQLSVDEVLTKLKPILEDEKIKKIGHNLKYELEILANIDITLRGIAEDTMLESYILDSSSINHTKDALTLKYLGSRSISYEDIAGKGAKKLSFDHIPIEHAANYAIEDADMALQLHDLFWKKLCEHAGQKYIFTEIEMPLLSVLAKMERIGVLIDSKLLEKQTNELEKRVNDLEQEIVRLAGMPFNINSPKQLQEILFTHLKLPVLQKTPTGQPSTAESVLQELALDFELPKLIIEFRMINKLITTYTKKLPLQVNPKTGRIHTSYNQTGAATGRLSSSEPNLQNIPIRREEGRRIRKAFIAPRGFKIISADYSQIELRIMAHISSDPNLLKAFAEGQDIHTATAAEILGIPLDKVTYEERRRAKAINFGLLYGMSAFGLAKQLGIPREAAQLYIDRYFARYPGVKNYMENTRLRAREFGYVETLYGRRLYIPDIKSSQIARLKAAERAAINAPLQGTAADIIKRAMISLDQWLSERKDIARMVMQVHDELVFEVEEKEIDQMLQVIKDHMMGAGSLKVPLLVTLGVGDNWDEAAG